jgi:hypothetical protein
MLEISLDEKQIPFCCVIFMFFQFRPESLHKLVRFPPLGVQVQISGEGWHI